MSRQPDHPAIGQFARKMRQKWNSPANAYNAVGTLNRLNAFLVDHGTDLLEATTDDLDDYIEWRRQHVSRTPPSGTAPTSAPSTGGPARRAATSG